MVSIERIDADDYTDPDNPVIGTLDTCQPEDASDCIIALSIHTAWPDGELLKYNVLFLSLSALERYVEHAGPIVSGLHLLMAKVFDPVLIRDYLSSFVAAMVDLDQTQQQQVLNRLAQREQESDGARS